MIEVCNPWKGCDVIACIPHKDTTQRAACSHCGNVMAGQCLNMATRPCDQPQLGHHRSRVQKEARH